MHVPTGQDGDPFIPVEVLAKAIRKLPPVDRAKLFNLLISGDTE